MAASRIYLKVVILGEDGVGKTTLVNQYVHRKCTYKYQPTIGVKFSTKDVKIDTHLVTLQIWDTSGYRKFTDLMEVYCKYADCCVLVYDVANSNSLRILDRKMDEFLTAVRPSYPEKFPFILIGNKLDRYERAVSIEEAIDWCKCRHEIPYFEVASLKGPINIDKAFQTMIRRTISNIMEQT